MEKTDNGCSSGFTGFLTLLFITLKLCGVIKWNWLWVLSPVWIGCAIFTVALIIAWAISIKE